MEQISKTQFKAHALEVLREIEQGGESVIITDRGKPTVEIKKLRQSNDEPLEVLKGSVIKFDGATEPVSVDDWENV